MSKCSKYMAHVNVDLPPHNIKDTFFKNTTGIRNDPEVHEWSTSLREFEGTTYVSAITGASKIGTKNPSNIQLKLYHCGGHNRYILLDDASSTRKSFFIVVFKVPDYKSYKESYDQLVGCHIESILSKDSQACIMLVGSYCDQVLKRRENKVPKNLFLRKGKQIFDSVKRHISSIMENTDVRPKLITCHETQIFYLSNTENINSNRESSAFGGLYDS